MSGKKCSKLFVPLKRGGLHKAQPIPALPWAHLALLQTQEKQKVSHQVAQCQWIVIQLQSLHSLQSQGFQPLQSLQLRLAVEQQPQWNLKLWLHQVAGLHKAQMQTWMAAGIWYQMHPLWKVWRWRGIDTLSVGLRKAHCLPKTLKHELAWKKRVQPVPLGVGMFFSQQPGVWFHMFVSKLWFT